MSESTAREISQHLSHLEAAPRDGQELARRFDLLILQLQLAFISKDSRQTKFISKIVGTAVALQVKGNIPQVAAQMPLIHSVQTETYWNGINVSQLETLRTSLRDLIQYLESKSQEIVYTNFKDDLDEAGIVSHDPLHGYLNLQSYKDRVEKYVRENRHHLTIDKLSRNEPITASELAALEQILFTDDVAGTRERLEEEYGSMPLGKFIRSILGLDVRPLKPRSPTSWTPAPFQRTKSVSSTQSSPTFRKTERSTRTCSSSRPSPTKATKASWASSRSKPRSSPSSASSTKSTRTPRWLD